MPDLAFFLLLHAEIEAVVFFIVGKVGIIHRMHQIEIKVSGTGPFELFIEDAFIVFFAFDLPLRKLGCDREAFTRIAVDDGLSDLDFRHAMVIDIGCIKISQTRFHIQIDHLADLFMVDDSVDLRKTHQSKAELWHFTKID